MKHVIVSCTLLILCVSFISCKGASPLQKSPGDVVKAFYMDANEGKYSDAKALLSDDFKRTIDGDLGQMNGGIKGVCDEASRKGTIAKVET